MQDGGSQYGAPLEMSPFVAAGTGSRAHVLGIPQQPHQQKAEGGQHQPPLPPSPMLAEAPTPMTSRQPLRTGNFDELAPVAPEGFSDEGTMAPVGEETDKGGVPGNRWPQEETLALLRIRSEMDAAFRDATLKGPLWEEVSRKLSQLGYKRSAKKCKEKFENVQKYYKRTKDGRAGRQDGKSYRFFRQLEALYGSTKTPATTAAGGAADLLPPSVDMGSSSARLQPSPLNAIPPHLGASPHLIPDRVGALADFSSDDSSASDSDGQDTEEGLPGEQTKRKRKGGSGGGGGKKKMMAFFEGLTRQVMERQEAMQQKFLEMIEKREQDKMIRDEAWRRQEMARLTREHEAMAQERAMSATRDATILAFLQKLTGHTISLPSAIATAVAPPAAPQQQAVNMMASVPTSSPAKRPQPPLQTVHQQASELLGRVQAPSLDVVLQPETQEVMDLASSRWPKSEVHALISLRSGMETRYQEAGPKAPLWEEIAAGMRRMGYNRSSKRCKEKWENINKYFKKVKDSKKKRPEDAKTCPYFHQLDALYRKKNVGAGSSSSDHHRADIEQHEVSFPTSQPVPQESHLESDLKRDNGREAEGNGSSSLSGSGRSGFVDEGTSADGPAKKPEDIMKDLMDQQAQREAEDSDKLEETDSDGVEQADDDDDEDDEKGKMAYKIQYQQRPVVNGSSSGGENQSAAAAAAAAAAAGSFMAMVQ